MRLEIIKGFPVCGEPFTQSNVVLLKPCGHCVLAHSYVPVLTRRMLPTGTRLRESTDALTHGLYSEVLG